MTEIPVGGVAVGGTGDGRFSILFPVRKGTATRFSMEAIETAAEIALWENLPIGWTIDDSKPAEKQWSETEHPLTVFMEPMVIVRLVVSLKEL